MHYAQSNRLAEFPVKEPERLKPDYSIGEEHYDTVRPLDDTLGRDSLISFQDGSSKIWTGKQSIDQNDSIMASSHMRSIHGDRGLKVLNYSTCSRVKTALA